MRYSRLAEWTPQEILSQPSQTLGVFGLHPDALIPAEPGELPTVDVGGDLIGDIPLGQQEFETFLFPQFEKLCWALNWGNNAVVCSSGPLKNG